MGSKELRGIGTVQPGSGNSAAGNSTPGNIANFTREVARRRVAVARGGRSAVIG
jgi:hypothetical protein